MSHVIVVYFLFIIYSNRSHMFGFISLTLRLGYLKSDISQELSQMGLLLIRMIASGIIRRAYDIIYVVHLRVQPVYAFILVGVYPRPISTVIHAILVTLMLSIH